jgi:hypothetical protein
MFTLVHLLFIQALNSKVHIYRESIDLGFSELTEGQIRTVASSDQRSKATAPFELGM